MNPAMATPATLTSVFRSAGASSRPAPASLSVALRAVRCRFCDVLLRLVRVVPEGNVCRHGYCGRAWCKRRLRGGVA